MQRHRLNPQGSRRSGLIRARFLDEAKTMVRFAMADRTVAMMVIFTPGYFSPSFPFLALG